MKERTISSVASSYDLVPQTVGSWVARYRKEHATDQDRKEALRVGRDREAESGKQGAAWGERVPEKSSRLLREGTTVTERYELINREEGRYPTSSMCRWAGVSRSGLPAPGATDLSPSPERKEKSSVSSLRTFLRTPTALTGTEGSRPIWRGVG